MNVRPPVLLSGDEAVALAALDAGVALATGYPGTPSTEILETFVALGGKGQWAPNEKVAMEVALGAAFASARALVTMKHVGVNVAADVLFTAAYSGVQGALVLVSADDPGMASSQNEQDNRRYAVAAGVPMLEPADSQEAYDFTRSAFEMSQKWGLPVMLRLTTRVCHSKTILRRRREPVAPNPTFFEHDIPARVMIPAHARPAHRRLRAKLAEIERFGEESDLHSIHRGDGELGIIVSGIAYQYAREAAPPASVLKLGLTYPLPMEKIRAFAGSMKRCVVIEEGDPYLADAIRAAGIAVESPDAMYRFGELNVARVRRILANDNSSESAPAKGKPPQLCPGCPYHAVFSTFKKLDCIVSGDIGCYTLGALLPHQAMDMQTCMGASIGVGLGLRHVLPDADARRVVSVIGDSTFMHSGLTGIAEMIYNPPKTGHVVIVLDNGTTAMTGQQEHPGTGRTVDHHSAGKVGIEDTARAMGVDHVIVMDAAADVAGFERSLRAALAGDGLTMIVTRKPCILAAGKIREYEKAATVEASACAGCASGEGEGCDHAEG